MEEQQQEGEMKRRDVNSTADSSVKTSRTNSLNDSSEVARFLTPSKPQSLQQPDMAARGMKQSVTCFQRLLRKLRRIA